MPYQNVNSNWHQTGRRIGIQLAYPFEEKRLLRWTPPYILQPKLDGERCRAVFDSDGNVSLYSSEANLIESVPHIRESLEATGLHGVELDGELYRHGMSLDGSDGIHAIVSTKRGLHPLWDEMQFHIFDIIDEAEIQAVRTQQLASLKHEIEGEHIVVVPFQFVHSADDCLRALDWSLKEGYEGIIVRHLEAPYIRRRSTMMMKFKPKREDIYEIVGYEEGLGKYRGMLGALICRAQEGEETFHVGSGFTDDQRAYLWSVRTTLPGLKVRVKYQHLTSVRGVPRSAVFTEIIGA